MTAPHPRLYHCKEAGKCFADWEELIDFVRWKSGTQRSDASIKGSVCQVMHGWKDSAYGLHWTRAGATTENA